MGNGRDDGVFGEVFHGLALVLRELLLFLIRQVRAGRDRALDGVESNLAFLGGDAAEPVLGAAGVLGFLGQGERVS